MSPTSLVRLAFALACLAPIAASAAAPPPSVTREVPYATRWATGANQQIDTSVTAALGLCGYSNLSGGVPGTGAGGAGPSGCYTRFGGLCAAAPGEPCDLATVPAGRCTNGSGSCIWPQGAGTCVDDPDIACLPDDPADHGQTSGTFPSSMCRDADPSPDDLCDMATNDPACACQGSDPSLPDWEGDICGDTVYSVCSDGDPLRTFGGLPTALCHASSAGGTLIIEGCGSASTSPGFLANVKDQSENPPRLLTPQRRPGMGAQTPDGGGPIRAGTRTFVAEIDEYGTGFYAPRGVRAIGLRGDSLFDEPQLIAGAVSGGQDANLFTVACKPPANWSINRPVQGSTPGDPGTRYCHEAALDGHGFIWTRELTAAEHGLAQTPPACAAGFCAGGALDGSPCATAIDCGTSACPPSCGNSYDLHTGEHAQLAALLDAVPAPDGQRAAEQLALDNLEGQRMGLGGLVLVQPLWLLAPVAVGDDRCFVGGHPDVVNGVCTGSCEPGMCDLGGTNLCLSGLLIGDLCSSDLECGFCDSGFLTGDACLVDGDCQRCGDGVSECDTAAGLLCADMVGQCDDNTGRACDPFVGGVAGGCGGSACRVCGGTPATQPFDPAFGGGSAWFDPVDGSDAPPLPIGYDTHGFAELDPIGRVSLLADVPVTQLRLPILSIEINTFARHEMRDDGLNVTNDGDDLAPGSNAPTGIGAAADCDEGTCDAGACEGTCDAGLCDAAICEAHTCFQEDVCIGGICSVVGLPCATSSDCHLCESGPFVNFNCSSDEDCSACGSGPNAGASCASDLDCSECAAGPNAGSACSSDLDCSLCDSGPNVGMPCTGTPDCLGCASGANAGAACSSDLDCGECDTGPSIGTSCVDASVCGLCTNGPTPGASCEIDHDCHAASFYPAGSVFSVDPTGPPATNLTFWEAESSTSFVPHTVNDFGPGPDGLPGCIGDNDTSSGSTCDPVASGADDHAIAADFGLDLLASAGPDPCLGVGNPHADCRAAVRARFPIGDPTRLAPILHSASATTLRDQVFAGFSSQDAMLKTVTTACPIIGSCDVSGNDCVDSSDCPGGETCSAREIRCEQKAYCQDEGGDGDSDQVCTSLDNCPAAANVTQADAEGDGLGDACDPCLTFDNSGPGGLDDVNGDGIPNVCQCGDANLNNTVDNNDLTTVFQCLGATPPAICGPSLASGKGEANNNNLWDNNDLSKIFAALSGGPTQNHTLTCANRPEGTPVP